MPLLDGAMRDSANDIGVKRTVCFAGVRCSMRVRFGLGREKQVNSIEIRWPRIDS
jgi:hypothetical protein